MGGIHLPMLVSKEIFFPDANAVITANVLLISN